MNNYNSNTRNQLGYDKYKILKYIFVIELICIFLGIEINMYMAIKIPFITKVGIYFLFIFVVSTLFFIPLNNIYPVSARMRFYVWFIMSVAIAIIGIIGVCQIALFNILLK